MNYLRQIRVKGIHYNLPAGILLISAFGKILSTERANNSKKSGNLALTSAASTTSYCDSSESSRFPSKESPCVAYSYPANNPSEDRWNIEMPAIKSAIGASNTLWRAAAVFDGHGGWQVSDFASKHLLKLALGKLKDVDSKDDTLLDRSINESFKFIEESILKGIKSSFDMGFGEVAKVGSCVILAFHNADRLVIANCGDCRAILGTELPSSKTSSEEGSQVKYSSMRITRDHNAREPVEVEILERNHPNEQNLVVCKSPTACYVKGRLQLTRSLGDAYLKHADFNGSPSKHRTGGRFIPEPYTPPYVSFWPDIHHLRLSSSDKFVILASDGLWDYLPEQEAVEIVAECMRDPARKEEAAEQLVYRALQIAAMESEMSMHELQALPVGRQRRSRHDDTTAVVMYL